MPLLCISHLDYWGHTRRRREPLSSKALCSRATKQGPQAKSCLPPVSPNKIYQNTTTLLCFCIVHGCFFAAKTEQCICYREGMVGKPKIFTVQTFTHKSLLTAQTINPSLTAPSLCSFSQKKKIYMVSITAYVDMIL